MSATMLQLNPSIPVETQFGYGEAVGWQKWGKEDSLVWIVLLSESRTCVEIPAEEVRACTNFTLWRRGRKVEENANNDWDRSGFDPARVQEPPK